MRRVIKAARQSARAFMPFRRQLRAHAGNQAVSKAHPTGDLPISSAIEKAG